jgi:hypothetical protein
MELPVFCFGQEGNGVSPAVNNICAGSGSHSLEGCVSLRAVVTYSSDCELCGHSALHIWGGGGGGVKRIL